MSLKNVTLEVSLKPFNDASEEATRETARRMFCQWLPLIEHADRASVMLWTADGSEILDYGGDLEATFEWCYWIGGANPRAANPADPEGIALHSRPYLFTEHPRQFTYGDLKRLVEILKEVGTEVTGKPVRVGETFDPGPEFAKSSFKYERHNEICVGGTMGTASFVCCYGELKGDTDHYAGFPDGIPEGTTIGTFLGRQSQHFLTDLGFDFLWLSNGFGFGMETWALRGAIFDGKSFSPARCEEVRDKILGFWQDFRKECPDFALETRGTNLSTGMDLSSDAAPLKDIYRGGFGMEPPPNSPWAALNGDFGLELIGWMSHIAELPADSYPFRFYTHDPWWKNSPWLDRYGREPHDIFLPMSVSRLRGDGSTHLPSAINFLSVDDSWGRMPEVVPREVTCHLLNTLETAPDQAAPLVWVYPFDEYHDMVYGKPTRIDEVFFGDWFMRGAVNNGLPLNCVISTGNFVEALQTNPAALASSLLVSPVPEAGSEWSQAILRFVAEGGRVLLYGPVRYADEELLAALNLTVAKPIEGDFELNFAEEAEPLSSEIATRALLHPGLFSAGGMEAVLREADGETVELAVATQGGQRRTAALVRELPQWKGGRLAWVRGTVSCDPERTGGHLLIPLALERSYPGERLMRVALASLGYEILLSKATLQEFDRNFEGNSPELKCPLVCVSRHSNGFVFAGYTPNTNARLNLRFPQGAPLLTGYETTLVEGRSTYSMPRAWRRECRVFVEQESGEVGCMLRSASEVLDKNIRLVVSGLKGATVRFYPEEGTRDKVQMLLDARYPYIKGKAPEVTWHSDRLGEYLEAQDVTGELLISW